MMGKARRAYVERLQELEAKIAEEVREWMGIDEYDADATQTKHKEFQGTSRVAGDRKAHWRDYLFDHG